MKNITIITKIKKNPPNKKRKKKILQFLFNKKVLKVKKLKLR
jgi:hypothetical protein